MRRTITKEFDGHTWELTEHPATEGQAIILSIGHLIGTAVESAGKSGITADSDIAVDGALVARLAQDVLGKVNPDQMGELTKLLVKYVKKDGEEVGGDAFDDAFAGDYVTLYKCVGWVIMENFRTVFQSTGIDAILATMPEVIKQAIGQASKPLSEPTTPPEQSASGRSGG